MQYACPRCGYTCDKKIILYRHLSKKIACIPVFNDCTPQDVLNAMISAVATSYACDLCQSTFVKRAFFLKHVMTCKNKLPSSPSILSRDECNE
jgi:hypothetical protein